MKTAEQHMFITCLDLEGVLVPEIWIGVADRTGIDELRLTTRDISDYDELMGHRLKILDKHGLRLPDIQDVIQGLSPMPGAVEFLDWLRDHSQVVILSDTFQEFAFPLMKQLKMPTLFCHRLKIDAHGRIENYILRTQDHKRKAVQAFNDLNFLTIAAGDSYNDVSMLKQAQYGIFFRPPDNIVQEFPEFSATYDYGALKNAILEAMQ